MKLRPSKQLLTLSLEHIPGIHSVLDSSGVETLIQQDLFPPVGSIQRGSALEGCNHHSAA